MSATATPTATPAPGIYAAAVSVSLACADAGATIYYTTDGTDPVLPIASSPMSPAALLLFIKAGLSTWVRNNKGYISLAGDPGEVIEALLDAPAGFRVVLNWAGDDDQTEQALAGITTQKIEVWLIKAKGLLLQPGQHLVTGSPAFLDLLSDLRAQIRALQFPDEFTSIFPLYRGCVQFEPSLALELPTTGYKLTFELIASIPALTWTDEGVDA